MVLGGGGTYEDLGVPMETEIWTFDTETTSKINSILPYNEYLSGTVLSLLTMVSVRKINCKLTLMING